LDDDQQRRMLAAIENEAFAYLAKRRPCMSHLLA
jgi:hypothetical protein